MPTRLQTITRESNAEKLRRKANKAAKKIFISNLYEQLEKIKQSNKGELPYGELNRQLIATNEPLSRELWITRHDIQNYTRVRSQIKTVTQVIETPQTEVEVLSSTEEERNKGG